MLVWNTIYLFFFTTIFLSQKGFTHVMESSNSNNKDKQDKAKQVSPFPNFFSSFFRRTLNVEMHIEVVKLQLR